MKKYAITKGSFSGTIWALYNEEGCLVYLNFEDAVIPADLMQSYKRYIPVDSGQLAVFARRSGATVTEVSITVSFEQWYHLLGVLRNKERAMSIWNKLPAETKVQAYYNTKKYLKYCSKNAGWYNKMYPDTYLRGRHWETDWDRVAH